MSVRIENLTRIFGRQRAVDDISFAIPQGQIVGFLGPNGAGKSTTMKMLTGYLEPSSGKAFVDDIDVSENSLEARRRIGYLPEHNPLYTEMYVKEYLRFIAGVTHYPGNVGRRVAELIEMTGLGIEQHKKIGTLSKGYRQRVGLAHALLHDPNVLILDEPTSGLDPNQLVDIRNLIRDTGHKKTVILSTHIMQEVQAMCSRVIIINRGKIVADDSTENLTARGRGEQILRVRFRDEMPKERLLKVQGVRGAARRQEEWVLNYAPETDPRAEINRLSAELSNPIYMLIQERADLESVFQNLTSAASIDNSLNASSEN